MGISCSQRSAGDLSLFLNSNLDYYGLGERGSLKKSLAPIYSPKEARFELLCGENLNIPITETHSSFFSTDNTASKTDLPITR
jgi:hypothetical protein